MTHASDGRFLRAKAPEEQMLEILEAAAGGRLSAELKLGESMDDLSVYEELIDAGYLVGTVLSDGSRPYFIGSCRITLAGREYLRQIKETGLWSARGLWRGIKPFIAGWIAGALCGATIFWAVLRFAEGSHTLK